MTTTEVSFFAPRQRLLSLTAVIATSFGVGLSFGVGFPLAALTFEVWQQPNWMVGLVSAVPALAVIVGLPFVPRLTERMGPVWAMVCGCSVGALGFLLMYFFQSAWAWVVIRFLMSAGLAIPWLTSETWINSVSRDETRGRVMAAYAIAFFTGFLIGPIALETFGLSGPLPFLMAALFVSAAVVPVLLVRKLSPPFHHDGTQNLLSTLRLAPTAMAGGFIGGFAEITCLSLTANVALAAGVADARALSLVSIMTAGGIALQLPFGWLSDKLPRVPLLLVNAAAFILLILLLPVLITTPTTSSVLTFLLGGVILGFYTLSLAIIGERVGARALAAANASFLVMYQMGAIVGPVAAGVAMTASPVIGFALTLAALMSICAVVIVLLEWTGNRR